ncbi:MAG: 2-phospho-L-lactate transferase CofD family protein, partial [Verrucomicrobiota bacterium]
AIGIADVIVFAPSNPIASIGPILAIPNMKEAIQSSDARRIAISPIVGGRSLKGPSDRMLRNRGLTADVRGVADYYEGLIDVLVIDEEDRGFEKAGLEVLVTQTVMKDLDDKKRLAAQLF